MQGNSETPVLEADDDDVDEESVVAEPKPSRERLQALERGLDALSFLNRYGAGTSTQVAKALQLKRSTAHRILAVLVNLGLLRHDVLNHQYILCGRVGELSSGFRDDEWVLSAAIPAMKAWTREHYWPLVLTTPLAGKLVVRASTDYESPISVDRFHCGQIIPVSGSTAGLIFLAYSTQAEDAAPPLHEPLHQKTPMNDIPPSTEPEDFARIRTAGYVARPTACFTGGRISVPLRTQPPFVGAITMRARAENIEVMSELHGWVASLKQLAARIHCAGPVV
jgi:IclR family mhp operon transcriptional activator